MLDLTATELAARLASESPPAVLDVRESWEVELATLDGALCISMYDVPGRLDELRALTQDGRELAVICHSGVRSRQIGRFLEHNGFDGILNVVGGIDAWSREVDQDVPTY